MRAMRLLEPAAGRVEPFEGATPEPGAGQVRLRVEACGVCRTDLHVVDGDLDAPKLPVTPGHEIVGTVERIGEGVVGLDVGTRVGVPWLGAACGQCRFCERGMENLCRAARYTGYQLDGGFADVAIADAGFVFPIPDTVDPVECAPWLCAGLIGYRSWRMALETPGGVERVGLYGFGAAAHLIAQVGRHEGKEIFAFTRPGDDTGQAFARELGAAWAGPSDRPAPVPLDAAILFAPVGDLVPAALAAVRPAGSVVCAGIHMSPIPTFPYRLLWEERSIRSVANLTRDDARQFLDLARRIPVRAQVHRYPLAEANRALDDLRAGRFSGAAVLVP